MCAARQRYRDVGPSARRGRGTIAARFVPRHRTFDIFPTRMQRFLALAAGATVAFAQGGDQVTNLPGAPALNCALRVARGSARSARGRRSSSETRTPLTPFAPRIPPPGPTAVSQYAGYLTVDPVSAADQPGARTDRGSCAAEEVDGATRRCGRGWAASCLLHLVSSNRLSPFGRAGSHLIALPAFCASWMRSGEWMPAPHPYSLPLVHLPSRPSSLSPTPHTRPTSPTAAPSSTGSSSP